MEDAAIEQFRNQLASLKEAIIEKYVYDDKDADEKIRNDFIKLYTEMIPTVAHNKILAYYLKLDLLIYNNTISPKRIEELEMEKLLHK